MSSDPEPGEASPADYELARHLYASGHLGEAYGMLSTLVSTDADPLWSSRGRTLLASICHDFEWFESVLCHLEVAIAVNADEDLTAQAREFHDGVAYQRDEVELDLRLPLLQANCCLERLSQDQHDFEAVQRLSRVVRALGSGPDQVIAVVAAEPMLRAAVARHPGSLELARGLLHCDLLVGDEEQVGESLRRLDELEPESRELETIATRVARGGDPPAGPGDLDAWRLVAIVEGNEQPALARAALADLRRRVARPPHSDVVTMMLGVALFTCGMTDELSQLVKALVNRPPRDQTFHYNLCQLLAAVGEYERANEHLDLARRLASTPEEEDEVAALYERSEWATARTDD